MIDSDQNSIKRALIIANKRWEIEPLMGVLFQEKARPTELPHPSMFQHLHPYWEARHEDFSPSPRAAFRLRDTHFELWCIHDLMDPGVSASSTAEKIRVLPKIFEWGGKPDLVVAVGTAGFIGPESRIGCVVIGTQSFIHNPFATVRNPQSPWSDDRVDQLLPSSLAPDFLPLRYELRCRIEANFLAPPINPARERIILASSNYLALSNVNITNYDDYTWADIEGVRAVERAGIRSVIGSVETTHAIIRIQSEAPFLFISGIANRTGCFDAEVSPRPYAQNFAAAHNAGMTAVWLIPKIAEHLSP